MAVAIRLTRIGKKSQAFYRIGVFRKRSKRNAKSIEILGFYNPLTHPPTVNIDRNRVQEWIKRGAEVSQTVGHIIKNHD